MEFSVPQFIEEAPKIVGPLTWRQFLFIGGAAASVLVLYFIIQHILVLLLITVFLMGIAVSLAFIKIEGKDLLTVFMNFLAFFFSSKLYVWRKTKIRPRIVLRKERVKIRRGEIERASFLTIGEGSRLRGLSTQIETRTR